ncbi:MAG: Na+/H+ antiporter NhaA [Actinomycetota bacterium]|nr:Na+/H+ antiporter NhaA [Actinomycetota bacterium]
MTSSAKQIGLERVARLQRGFAQFVKLEVAGSVVLLCTTVLALGLANSPLAEWYHSLWEIEIGISVGGWHFAETLLHWIDDGLMALFFFVVGLEIKREVLVGELSSARKAALPILAACGGMIVPALIYIMVNRGGDGASGWGVPMATDIAFALGVLALLGSRIPTALKVFLTALAIADDIGAILVIALFYTEGIALGWLGIGLALLLVLVMLNLLGVDGPLPYFLVACVVWFAFLHSGVHATVAGVLVAFTIPAKARTEPVAFIEWARGKLDEIELQDVPGSHVLDDPVQQHRSFEIREAARYTAAPLQRLEHTLLPLTSFIVLPLFALANAGVTLVDYDVGALLLEPVTVGVFLGLLVGKTLGITAFTWLAVRFRLADLPAQVGWAHIVGAGMLGGIGFTMSLFVSNLAFRGELLRAEAKLGILLTSVIAGVLGYLVLRYAVPQPAEDTFAA